MHPVWCAACVLAERCPFSELIQGGEGQGAIAAAIRLAVSWASGSEKSIVLSMSVSCQLVGSLGSRMRKDTSLLGHARAVLVLQPAMIELTKYVLRDKHACAVASH